jgi:TPR repeat protein
MNANSNINIIKEYKTKINNGDMNATFNLGVVYFKGKIIKKDLKKAFYYFKLASDYGNTKARLNLGLLYLNKKFDKYNSKKGFEILNQLAKNNNKKAQYFVGYSLLRGIGTETNYKKALDWFEYSYFENNYLKSTCMIAIMYANGFGRFQNLGRANKMAQIGAKEKLPLCINVIKEFKLYRYKKDKGFKFGYY